MREKMKLIVTQGIKIQNVFKIPRGTPSLFG